MIAMNRLCLFPLLLAVGPIVLAITPAGTDAPIKTMLVTTLKGHTKPVLAVALSSNSFLGSGGEDCTVVIWDLKSFKMVNKLRGHKKKINALAFHPDGKTLASGSDDGTIIFWDVATGKRGATLNLGPAYALAYSKDGDRLIVAGFGSITVWNIPLSKAHVELKGHKQEVRSVAFSNDGKLLASGGSKGKVIIWDTVRWKEKVRLEHVFPVNAVTFGKGDKVVVGFESPTVKVWDVTGRESMVLKGHTDSVLAVAASDLVVASGGYDKTLLLRKFSNGEIIAKLHENKGPITCLAISRDGRWLFCGSFDNSIRVWSLK